MKSRIANAVSVDGAGVYKEGVGGCTYMWGSFSFSTPFHIVSFFIHLSFVLSMCWLCLRVCSCVCARARACR